MYDKQLFCFGGAYETFGLVGTLTSTTTYLDMAVFR